MEKFKIITSLALLLGLSACSSPERELASLDQATQIDSGIIGGEDVQESDVMMQSTVGLYLISYATDFFGNTLLDEDGKPVEVSGKCTGTIISDNVVLTAAHCLENLAGGAVVFGKDMDKAVEEKKFLAMTHGYIHPNYGDPEDNKNSHDIGLIRFSGKLPAGYKKAKMLSSASLLKKNQSVTLVGYGASKEIRGDMEGAGVLRKATVPLVDPNYSESEIKFTSASANGANACHGDSGGPAYSVMNGELTLIGVTSRTTDQKGGCHTDSLYSNVGYYKTLLEKEAATLQNKKDDEE